MDTPERGPAPTTPILCDRCARPVTTSNTKFSSSLPATPLNWTPPPLMRISCWNVWPLPGLPLQTNRPPSPSINRVHKGWQSRPPHRRPRRQPPRHPPHQTPHVNKFQAPEEVNSQNQPWGQNSWEHPKPFSPLQKMEAPTTKEPEPYHWPKGQVRPPRKQVGPRNRPPPVPIELRPLHHQTCRGYFLPGSLGGQEVHCLLDSGCTVSVVSKRIFNKFRPALRDLLIAESGIAHVADGSTTKTYGNIELFGKLRHWRYTHSFLVADIREDLLWASISWNAIRLL